MIRFTLRPLLWLTGGLFLTSTVIAVQNPLNRAAAVQTTLPTHTAAQNENPTVAPGSVKWHSTFADAQAASRQSGKPVLVFHMMGQLDKQFC